MNLIPTARNDRGILEYTGAIADVCSFISHPQAGGPVRRGWRRAVAKGREGDFVMGAVRKKFRGG